MTDGVPSCFPESLRLFQVVGKIDDTLALLNLVSGPSFPGRDSLCPRPPSGRGGSRLAPLLPWFLGPRGKWALAPRVGRAAGGAPAAWSDPPAPLPPSCSQACMMTITFLPFTVSAGPHWA